MFSDTPIDDVHGINKKHALIPSLKLFAFLEVEVWNEADQVVFQIIFYLIDVSFLYYFFICNKIVISKMHN